MQKLSMDLLFRDAKHCGNVKAGELFLPQHLHELLSFGGGHDVVTPAGYYILILASVLSGSLARCL